MNETISVSLVYDGKTKKSIPRSIVWKNRIYRVTKLGLHHTYKDGDKLLHVFSVVAGSLFFRLVFDTSNLHWKLTEIQDELVS
ncbi:hypothetical protein A2803_05920 [Candidatus Woesebacteria bacterium RIFCSPHIGHO2_01_FULL_44_21]|uniref:Uncharacterized protein n=1 Tax=Candidatus Woesebacteria bacterium RIFCSPHIGHO2_01_FULL_44_21 TaxID=1802503 RepID=A0A1F7YZQ4_9BACT|nr:MAG: hypothetical protein A2803_05920 [Candidatus Woesebacteria bacterium RIFCSPHIGHO2_01_FULL_44_21]OGM71082.1 MAG: hypothetical protein A2897_02505 [Candidatus Woesebacteria bacterium RIFCSPLOWO2_01_FULL_44_24b]